MLDDCPGTLTFSWQVSAPSTSLTGYAQRDCLLCDLCSGDCISEHDVDSAMAWRSHAA
jgi:hypothetical protein